VGFISFILFLRGISEALGRSSRSLYKSERWGEMEDWKKFLSGDFLMNVIGVVVGLWIWNKFLAKRL